MVVMCYWDEFPEIFALLGLGSLTLGDGADRLSRNVGNYQSALRNIPEECGDFICTAAEAGNSAWISCFRGFKTVYLQYYTVLMRRLLLFCFGSSHFWREKWMVWGLSVSTWDCFVLQEITVFRQSLKTAVSSLILSALIHVVILLWGSWVRAKLCRWSRLGKPRKQL
jgi:hypothetical protein